MLFKNFNPRKFTRPFKYRNIEASYFERQHPRPLPCILRFYIYFAGSCFI